MTIKLPEMNQVIITGRLTRNAELRHTQSGQAMCKFDIAVSSRYLDKTTNEWKDNTVYVNNMALWGDEAERKATRLLKGTAVMVEGKLKLEEWTDKTTGKQQQKLTVAPRRVQILTKSESAEQEPSLSKTLADRNPPVSDDVPF